MDIFLRGLFSRTPLFSRDLYLSFSSETALRFPLVFSLEFVPSSPKAGIRQSRRQQSPPPQTSQIPSPFKPRHFVYRLGSCAFHSRSPSVSSCRFLSRRPKLATLVEETSYTFRGPRFEASLPPPTSTLLQPRYSSPKILRLPPPNSLRQAGPPRCMKYSTFLLLLYCHRPFLFLLHSVQFKKALLVIHGRSPRK